MKKIYKLENIHCADCARALEETIKSFNGVKKATINFVTEKFEVEFDDDKQDDVLKKIKKLLYDFSKDVVMTDISSQKKPLTKAEILLSVKGVRCKNCAKKIEDSVARLSEVEKSTFDFEKKTILVSINQESSQQLVKRIIGLIKNIEPSCKIKELNKQTKKKVSLKLISYCLGLIPLAIVILETFGVIHIAPLLHWAILLCGSLLLGYETYITAIKMLLNKNINENLLVTISVFGAIAVGEHMEALMVVALYTLGKMLEAKAVNKSRRDIQALINIKPEFATLLRGGEEIELPLDEIKIGDIIVVKPGQKIAIDGVIVSGESYLDVKSLTGESKPLRKECGDKVVSGATAIDGRLEIKATCINKESTVTKILNLIQKAAEKKSKTETFIAKFAKYYTGLVLGLSLLTGVITGIVLGDWAEAVYRGLIFLVISCPCAFAISVPLSYFSGIGNASRKGILIKGTNYLDSAAKAKIVAFDKTGTLTTGEFIIKSVEVLEDAYTQKELVELAAIGEQNSIHPIAKTIVKAAEIDKTIEIQNFKEVAGEGIYFELEGTEYFVGRDNTEDDQTVVIVKKGNVTLGKIFMEDQVRTSSKLIGKKLKALGVDSIILSGDKIDVAQKVGKKLNISDVRAELLPQEKYEEIEKILKSMDKRDKLVYVGDGINDAPSLALADVGVSMGLNGSPASIEASDVVLVDDDPSKIVELIKLSKFTKKVVLQNIIFASLIKASCLLLGALGIANMVVAVFADVGVTLLAILNSLRVLKHKKH